VNAAYACRLPELALQAYRSPAREHRPAASFAAAQAAFVLGHETDARRILSEPGFLPALLSGGTRALNRGEWNRALQLLDAALALDTVSAPAHRERGRVLLYGFGRVNDAVEELRRATILGDQEEVGRVALAHALSLQGRWDAAVAALDAAGSTSGMAEMIRGDAARIVGDLPRALAHYLQAEAGGFRSPWLFHSLALCYTQQGDVAAARRYWRAALSADPAFGPAHEGLRSLGKR